MQSDYDVNVNGNGKVDEKVFETPSGNANVSESANASETSNVIDDLALSTSFPQTAMKMRKSHWTRSRILESWVRMRMVVVMVGIGKVMTMAFGVKKPEAQSELTLKGDRTGWFRKGVKTGDEYQDFQKD